jgi:LuxR family maltose regulon positive regulatory protein
MDVRSTGWTGSDTEVVQTKLQPPTPNDDLLPRPQLVGALHGALATHRLTLASAPAGYGKTTLLASLPGVAPDLRLTWVSLDEDDNQPAQFMAVLVAALQRLDPAYGATVRALLSAPSVRGTAPDPTAEMRRLMGVLINDVVAAEAEPFVLALDDLHLIREPAIHAGLDYLIERMPAGMRLLVATRDDPPLGLARLRARGQLAELRLGDLRFTLDEVAVLLNDRWQLDLSADEVEMAQGWIEGWPAGLRLLAGSLDGLGAPEARRAFLSELPRADALIFDFLAEEVLRREGPGLRVFLEETSILTELTPALCQAVTGREDAAGILRELHRRNLFVTAADSTHTSFRYHHLFAAFLRERLGREQPTRVAELHARAGAAEVVPGRAIGHYLAAERWEEAATVIEEVGQRTLHQGFIAVLRSWIEALPAAVRDGRPRLLHLLGVCCWQQGEFEAAQELLDAALRGFEAAGDERAQGAALAELATCALLRSDFERLGALAPRALALPLPPPSRVQVLAAQVNCSWVLGAWGQVIADFETALAVAEEAQDPDVLRALLPYIPPSVGTLPGGLALVERLCRRFLAHCGDEVSQARLAADAQLAIVHLFRGRADEAISLGGAAFALAQRLGHVGPIEVSLAATLAVAHTARGEYAAADPWFDALFRYLDQVPMLHTVRAANLCLLGRRLWLEGRLADVRRTYADMCAAEDEREMPVARPTRPMMRARLQMSEGAYAEAEHALREAADLMQALPASRLFGNPQLLLAMLYLRWNRPDDALAALAPTLAECEREDTAGFILNEGASVIPVLQLAVQRGVHAAFSASLLDRLGVPLDAPAAPRPEAGERRTPMAGPAQPPLPAATLPLTPREREVAALVARGLTNRQIADELVISERTAETHVQHILGKLDLSSRVQLATWALAHGLH